MDNSSDHRPEGHLTAEFQPYRKNLLLNDNEIEESHVNIVVIDELREKLGPAMMHIWKQQVIEIGADGVGAFQHERVCWLQIATKNKVYLFDILMLEARAFNNSLSMILENNHIVKVTYSCQRIAGCLRAQFGVNLSNVFDTQVADIMCFYTETGGFLPDRSSVLELPRELRELKHMRQEWAIDRYPVTEQGLLERSNPRPLPPSQDGQGQNTATQRQPDPPVPTAEEPVVPGPVPGLQAPAEQRPPVPAIPMGI